MPFSIYPDDCSDDDSLINLLRHAGSVIVSPRDIGTLGSGDADHLDYAARQGHALPTHNPRDFRTLHN
jgi:hypothetical protein